MIKRSEIEPLNRIYIYIYAVSFTTSMNGSEVILFLPFYKSKLFEHEFLQSLLSALDFSLCILQEEFLENEILFLLRKVHHYLAYYLNVQNLFLEGFILLDSYVLWRKRK